MSKELVSHWCELLERTVNDGQNKPLRSDDERIVKLYETTASLITQGRVDAICKDYESGVNSTLAIGIAYLKDAYESRSFSASVKSGVKANGRGWAARSKANELAEAPDEEAEINQIGRAHV